MYAVCSQVIDARERATSLFFQSQLPNRRIPVPAFFLFCRVDSRRQLCIAGDCSTITTFLQTRSCSRQPRRRPATFQLSTCFNRYTFASTYCAQHQQENHHNDPTSSQTHHIGRAKQTFINIISASTYCLHHTSKAVSLCHSHSLTQP